MSRLSELIAELCPDGVEYKALEEVAELVRGSGLQKKDFSETGVGCIHYGQIHTKFGAYTDVVLSYVPEELAKKLTVVHPGDVVVAATSEDVSACCKAVAWMGDVDVVTGGHCVVVRHDLDPKYLSYCFQTDSFYAQKKRFAAGVKVIEMRTDKLARIRIPVPPIEVQREVVRILDEYTAAHDELVRQLEEEMALREQELSTARNELLKCREGAVYKALGDVGVFMRGSSFQKKHFADDGTPCIHYGQVHTRFNIATDEVVSYLDESFAAKMKRAQPGDLIIATTSEDDDAVGKAIAWLGDTDVVVSNDAYIYRHELDPKYMAYVFASDLFQEPKRQYITGTKVRRLNDKSMSKIVIPVPPIEVQREVVRVLDDYTSAYDKFMRQVIEERAARDQQIALVRNQLLSFPEKVA